MRTSVLTVFFENPFWVAILERTEENSYQVARVVLGSEPSDAELYCFLSTHYHQFRFSPPVPIKKDMVTGSKVSVKRSLRNAKNDMAKKPGTKAQLAIGLMYEQHKIDSHSRKSKKAEEMATVQREMKIQKHKKKHRGH